MDGVTPSLGPATLVCHCLLIESDRGLVLVDTGFGLEDMRRPRERLAGFFRALNRPARDESMTAIRQIEKLGYAPSDVRHIVLTHLDFDHAGGLSDFPEARVHLLGAEIENAREAHGFIQRRRFSPSQWTGVEQWRTYSPGGEVWYGFDCVRDLEGLPPEILLVPLVGHTFGHSGVAIRSDRGWLLHAGDAYFHHHEMDFENPRCPAGASAYQTMMEVDRRARLRNQERLRDLSRHHGAEVRLFCSHDKTELDHWIGTEHRVETRGVG